MPTDKDIKKEFKLKASKTPEKYYATGVLKGEGFMRRQCACETFYWTVNADQETCGDPACSGGFRFFDKPPAKNKMDYIEVWQNFSKLFSKLGYTPIKRYPVTARWRTDTDFVQASIYDFQPFVVSGEVAPPANPLVVPQFCVRFNDIDNVGITGAHYTGFVMIGQHAFMPKDKFDQPKYFSDIKTWLNKGLGLPNEEITFHEDAWAGGGNFGPSMEYFSRGLELGNQVYMLYEVTPQGPKDLNLKVLDMGMGHERNAWFTQGTSTSYETTFPTACKKLYAATGIKVDKYVMQRFLPYASYLNVDEVENIDKAWQMVSAKMKMDTKLVRDTVQPLAALYSVAEHTRSLLFALNDGALPSNVRGGYNLRVILRRALSFIDHYNWDVHLADVAQWHADYLKPLFPELSEHLNDVHKILDVEKSKYENTKQKSRIVVQRLLATKEKITDDKLLTLYDSQGISPELIHEEAETMGTTVKVPENFYARVAELHQKQEAAEKEEKEMLPLDGIPDTKAVYYEDYKNLSFSAKVLKIMGQHVVLDRTYFYPTSGGQDYDTGVLGGQRVVDVFKQGGIILHKLADAPTFRAGDSVAGEIDRVRRFQLAQHHTATHIINAAAKRVLGNHINQAGARKQEEKAHIDITHYQSLTDDELQKIEDEANRIVQEAIATRLKFYPRTEAEQRFGMRIYQGGVVPGKELRIVEIPEVDVECCGGTHLHNTKEAGRIKLLKSQKISDGIVRITFVAGSAASKKEHDTSGALNDVATLLDVPAQQVPARVQELFEKWKLAMKAAKKKQTVDSKQLALTSAETYNGDALQRAAEILKTQPEHVLKTIKRFLAELEECKKPR
ncbi:alanine--tRNA ligase [Candidatus Woesearchaeota archaeon]|nr:alanine--tRNA ligase [Candidatus Woesearchaeota archaeon]